MKSRMWFSEERGMWRKPNYDGRIKKDQQRNYIVDKGSDGCSYWKFDLQDNLLPYNF